MQTNESRLSIAEEFQLNIQKQERYDKIMGIAPMLVLLILLGIFSIFAPGFFSVPNVFVLLNQLAIPLIIATGVTFVILIGSIDLSVEGVMGLSGAAVGLLVLNDKTGMELGIFGIILAVLVGGLCGLVSGIIFVKGKIPSFMVTFGMSSVTSGLAMLSYGALAPNIKDEVVRSISLTKYFGLPIFCYVALALFLIAYFVEKKTAFGEYIYAIGQNESLAKLTGINVDRIKIMVFVWCGFFIGIAGVCGASQIGRGDVSVGIGMLFPALAAIVVGGTSLSGGKGGVISTLIGTFIITVLNNGLVLIGANTYYKNAILGVVLVIAVILTVKRNRKEAVK